MASSTWTGAGSSAQRVAWPLSARSPRSRAWPLQAAVAGTAAATTPTAAGSAGCRPTASASSSSRCATCWPTTSSTCPAPSRCSKDAGYAEVEIGGTYDGRTAADFRALAEAAGLKPEGSHVPGGHNSWRTNLQGVLDDAEALGLRYVGIASPPAARRATHDGYKALADEFNAFGQAARDRGFRFYFHNHPTDFVLDGGTPIYDTLLANTDPSLVWFELDIAWIEAGGQSAVDYVNDEPQAVQLFHVKDLRWADDGPRVTPPNVAAAEPQVLDRRRRQGRHRLRAHLLGARRPEPPPLLRRARRRARRRDGGRHLAAPAQPGRLGEHRVDEPQVPGRAPARQAAPPQALANTARRSARDRRRPGQLDHGRSRLHPLHQLDHVRVARQEQHLLLPATAPRRCASASARPGSKFTRTSSSTSGSARAPAAANSDTRPSRRQR